jgi:hypothetical protein
LEGAEAETQFDPRPRYRAEQYRAAGKLAGKVAIMESKRNHIPELPAPQPHTARFFWWAG